jgi:uncharacterized protein YndB with AHSA1/START domain
MIKTIAIVVVALVALVLIYAATKPDTFLVQRSVTIAAAPDKIFPLIHDPRAFNTWNPFVRKDPAVKLQYEGPSSGVGAAYSWEGEKSGAGRMVVTAVEPNAKVQMRLNFTKPFEANNTVDFSLTPQSNTPQSNTTPGSTTQVTWAMHGPMPYLHKVMTTFFSMDKMVGADFEAGLVNLKTAVERPS